MRLPRASGILLHPTSLPGRHGIGDLGRHAHEFVEFLAATGQRWWQMLPLGPTGYGNSPYQSPSSFAGNPSADRPGRPGGSRVAGGRFLAGGAVIPRGQSRFRRRGGFKEEQLRLAHEDGTGSATTSGSSEFVAANHVWLDDYALYHALKDSHGGLPWYQWEPELVVREAECSCDLARAIERRDQLPLVRPVRIRDPVAGAAGGLPGARRDAVG